MEQLKELDLLPKKISSGWNSRISGLSIGEFIDLIKDYGMTLNLELEDAKQALKYAKELI